MGRPAWHGSRSCLDMTAELVFLYNGEDFNTTNDTDNITHCTIRIFATVCLYSIILLHDVLFSY